MPEIEKNERTAAPIGRKTVTEAPAPAEEAREDSGSMAAEDYERLLDMYDVSFKNFAEGEVVKGVVLQVSESEVIVDVGYKSEGIIPLDEFRDETGKISIKVGDMVDVLLEKTEDKEGYVVLSKEKAEKMKVWDDVEKAYQERRVVVGRVIERVKGGLAVDIGVRAFLPGSQVDLRPVRNLDSLKGQELRMRVIKVNKKRGNIVLSRKALLEEENAEKKKHTLETLAEGKVLKGVVKNITDYGAFIDLGGIDGLLHVTDMSHGRITHPSEILHVGDEITVKVLKFDRAKERVSLGIKQLEPDPWETVAERYPVNGRVIGRVVNVTDYGAFIELESGVEGLIHISEMTWSRRMKHPSKVVKPGDQVEAVVLEVHSKDRRISLGLKQLEPNPWTTIDSRYSVGSVVEGRVRNMTDFGAFIEIEEGIDGLVHVSDLSWTKRVKHPSEILKKGQIVQAVILNIDSASHRLSLGIKQLQPDAWESYFQNHQVGDIVHGRICRLASFGAFVELAEGVEGLCHFSEVPGYSGRRGSEELPVSVGQDLDFKIIKMSEAEKKIGLSLRAVADDEEKTRLEDYQRQAAAATTTIEEVMSLKDRNLE